MRIRRNVIVVGLVGLVLASAVAGGAAVTAASRQATHDTVTYEGSYKPVVGVDMEDAMRGTTGSDR